MGTEIERKFLLRDESWRAAAGNGERYVQGYLGSQPACSIRIRIAGERAWLNIKSATLGIERAEYDYPIPVQDARDMVQRFCAPPLVEKTRYHVRVGAHVWEIDEFEGDNAGLVVAEIELGRVDEPFEAPAWLGAEVSHDPRYYNVSLARHPFKRW
ncbi:MAG: CYTH domain-containing protein [Gammaproteobacteria bacterium]